MTGKDDFGQLDDALADAARDEGQRREDARSRLRDARFPELEPEDSAEAQTRNVRRIERWMRRD